MSDNYTLIIKNGNCYIDGKLTKADLGLSGNKIKKIGKIKRGYNGCYISKNARPKVFITNKGEISFIGG